MGVLSDFATSNPRNGDLNSSILRWTRRASICIYHRWIHLVLLYFHHYSRSCRHLDGTISLLLIYSCLYSYITYSLAFEIVHFALAALRKSFVLKIMSEICVEFVEMLLLGRKLPQFRVMLRYLFRLLWIVAVESG